MIGFENQKYDNSLEEEVKEGVNILAVDNMDNLQQQLHSQRGIKLNL